MKIYRHVDTDIPNWYICNGEMKGRKLFGAGITPFKAFKKALES